MGSCDCCSHKLLGIMCVIGGALIHITYGYFYTVGNMTPYIVDYMNFNNMSVEQTSAVWLTTVGFGMQAIAMPLGAMIATKVGFRIVVLCSCIVHSGSIALTYLAIKWGFWAVVLIYGIFTGIAFGSGYSVILAVASAWFPAHRGLIVGCVLAGFGAGALIFTPIQTGYINPNNLQTNATTKSFTDPVLLSRVPKVFLVLAGITAGMQLIGWLLMREKPKASKDNEPRSDRKEDQHKDIELRSISSDDLTEEYVINLDRNRTVDVSPMTALKSADFYLLWLSVCSAVIPITLTTSLFKVAGRNYINDDLFLAGVSMTASVCNSVGRIFWGMVCDHLSFKIPMCAMCLVWTAFLFSFPYISVFTGTAAKVCLVFWVGLLFWCQCGVFVFAPNATTTIFGSANMAVNYGLLYTAFLVGSLIASLMTNLSPKGTSIQQHFMVGGACAILAILILLLVVDRKVPLKCKILNAPVLARIRYFRRGILSR